MYPSLRIIFGAAVVWTLLAVGLLRPASAQEPLKLSVYPYLSSTELINRFLPFSKYLGKRIGRPVTIEIATSYDTHIDRVGSGGVDLAFMGPASYVKFTAKYGTRPILAAYETKEGKYFHGHIMVRKDSPITSLAALKGKRFVFGDPVSTMSHYVPRHMLLKAGVEVKDFSQVTFLANQENIALGVLVGVFDAGAVKEEIFQAYEQRGLRSLARSAPISDHLFIASNKLSEETVRALREACLTLSASEEGRRIVTGLRKDVTALIPGDDKDFDILRTIVKELKEAGVEL